MSTVNGKPLGRLERVDLREVWDSEAGSFTPWLAQPDNLRLLGETIGIADGYEQSLNYDKYGNRSPRC